MSDIQDPENVMAALAAAPKTKRGKLTVEICLMAQAMYAKQGQVGGASPQDTQQVGLKPGWGGQGR